MKKRYFENTRENSECLLVVAIYLQQISVEKLEFIFEFFVFSFPSLVKLYYLLIDLDHNSKANHGV